MILCKWEKLPEKMRTQEVRKYYDCLKKKTFSLILKRIFDIVVSLIMIILLSPVLLVLSIMIKRDSEGPVMFRQVRITAYGKEFRIFKFRTMKVVQAANASLTVGDDDRITKVGRKIRSSRLDELPQLFNVLAGDMTFVGTRPEVPRYVDRYSPEMMATLLLPAGITSMASIEYREESEELAGAEDPAEYYVDVILPKKMSINLREIERFSAGRDIKTMFATVKAVL